MLIICYGTSSTFHSAKACLTFRTKQKTQFSRVFHHCGNSCMDHLTRSDCCCWSSSASRAAASPEVKAVMSRKTCRHNRPSRKRLSMAAEVKSLIQLWNSQSFISHCWQITSTWMRREIRRWKKQKTTQMMWNCSFTPSTVTWLSVWNLCCNPSFGKTISVLWTSSLLDNKM